MIRLILIYIQNDDYLDISTNQMALYYNIPRLYYLSNNILSYQMAHYL